MRSKPLTPRQADVLAYIDSCITRGIPPTREEIGNHFGWASPKAATTTHFRAIKKKGFIEVDSVAARGIRIIKRRDGNKVLIRGQWYEFIRFTEGESDRA